MSKNTDIFDAIWERMDKEDRAYVRRKCSRSEKSEAAAENRDSAIEVLEFLNEKTGKNYPVRNARNQFTSNFEVIAARLNDGYTLEQCRAVVATRCREWGADEKMSAHLTPATIFRKSNFEKYIGALKS